MTVKAKKESLGFETEVQQLLDLMIHSLYSNKEIFLRELISNASDAADKLRFEGLQDDSLFEADPTLQIRVEYNKEQQTISIIDNGIGMSREEVIDNLGTIAKSGTQQFFAALTGDQSKDSQLVGQFGVGFYSAFIVARDVEVLTRRAGLGRSEGVRWISDGKREYTVETIDRPRRGTRVTLHLHDEHTEFADGFRLRSIIKKYSDHISLPILMPKEGKDETGDDTVNSATALWRRNKKDLSDEEYETFYKHLSHDFEAPLARIHNRVEGNNEYTSLLYIPARAPFDLWDREQRHGVKLYVKRIFIMDDAEQLMPTYLRFVKGVVDSDNLPLNISRELLQQNKTIDSIRAGCTKKVLDLLQKMADREADKYQTFWRAFGRVLKEGIIDAPDKKETLIELFRFRSTAQDAKEDGETVSLAHYKARMQADQKAIYYVTAENHTTARHSPHLEIFKQKGIEVLLLTDPIDEWLTSHLTEYQTIPLQAVNKGELDLGAAAKAEADEQSKDSGQFSELTERINEVLKDKVKAVRITHRLTESPACLVADTDDMGRHLQQILTAAGQEVPASKPILEINPEHPLVAKLAQEQIAKKQMAGEQTPFADWSEVLFDQALLSEGGQLADPAAFVHRLNSLFLKLSTPD